MGFHEFANGMSVMDGSRCIASAKPTPHGWILTFRGGCWAHPRARTQGLIPGKFPNLMLLPSRRAVRQEFQKLARPIV